MIQGRFGEKGEIYFDIDLVDVNGLSFSVEAMLDTGFTELMIMNQQDIETLKWILLGQDKLRTAQGEAIFNIYLGKVVIAQQEFEIPVFAGEDIQEVLLGSQWLKLFILIANYQQGRVTLERM